MIIYNEKLVGRHFDPYRKETKPLFFYSQGLADSTVVAKVNDELWDLDRPFEGDAALKLLKFDDPDGNF